ncbi:hypothetical protein [Streptomyces sp. NPDC048277]|uniref:hypothetical protein n=1 Tax=Streptomyces sp. NPDC048277 TaxID=3155027 RepID=UPI0033DF670A
MTGRPAGRTATDAGIGDGSTAQGPGPGNGLSTVGRTAVPHLTRVRAGQYLPGAAYDRHRQGAHMRWTCA